ncbi:MAG: site-2 protease family protein [Bifidobacteriaceae bacterium]|jgi:membrane-associated protease RseP (regulator of RpoE activity)|nr:site-2 protease family protein [Bifidobacteriaceae bacterium]
MVVAILTIIIIIVGITLSVTLHEAGHTFTAKAFGVPVSEFMVGFGPTLFSKKIGETEYGFKPILLGGYSKILGMFPPTNPNWKDKGPFRNIIKDVRAESAKSMEGYDSNRAFYWLSTPKKVLVMAGGTLTNLLLGFIFFALAFCTIGAYQPSTTLQSVAQCLDGSDKCSESAMTPAAQAGLKKGDEIIEINGQKMVSWNQISEVVSNSGGKELEIFYRVLNQDQSANNVAAKTTVIRVQSSSIKKAVVKPVLNNGRYIIGVTSQAVRQPGSLLDAAQITWQAFSGTVSMVTTLPYQTYKAIESIFTQEKRGGNTVLSLVGVGQIAVDQTTATNDNLSRIASLLSLLGSLNIALFVLNLIPLLPLDGGHVVNSLYEGAKRAIARIRGKKRPAPSDLSRSMPLAYFVYGLLIFCGVALILVDILNPIKL